MEAVAALALWLATLDGCHTAAALSPGLPPLSDLARFPSAAVVDANCRLAREHQDWLTAQLALAPPILHDFWWEWKAETVELWQAWEWLSQAQSPHNATHDRRDYLNRLRVRLGASHYNGGCLLPPVPLWRFSALPAWDRVPQPAARPVCPAGR